MGRLRGRDRGDARFDPLAALMTEERKIEIAQILSRISLIITWISVLALAALILFSPFNIRFSPA
jgi:hypothetical protein